MTLTASNSRLVLDIARAGGFERIGLPELVLEETRTVLGRTYGQRVAFSASSFLLRLCTPIPRDRRLSEEMEKAEGRVPAKDLEVVAAVRVFRADLLVAYDRHFEDLGEYRTPKRMMEEFGVRPFPSQY